MENINKPKINITYCHVYLELIIENLSMKYSGWHDKRGEFQQVIKKWPCVQSNFFIWTTKYIKFFCAHLRLYKTNTQQSQTPLNFPGPLWPLGSLSKSKHLGL